MKRRVEIIKVCLDGVVKREWRGGKRVEELVERVEKWRLTTRRRQ